MFFFLPRMFAATFEELLYARWLDEQLRMTDNLARARLHILMFDI
jgi:hypothetical protein